MKKEVNAEDFENASMEERTAKEIADYRRRITSEKTKLTRLFKDSDDNVKKIATPLIENAAYMRIELLKLKDYNIKNGIKEFYMNGKGQFGYKESVESKTYNAMLKNYIAINKQLNELLPKNKQLDNDEFDDF